MSAFFHGIQWLFEHILFIPFNFFRRLQVHSWWGANLVNWILFFVCAAAFIYWIKQLRLHKENGEENQDTTAHSFLK